MRTNIKSDQEGTAGPVTAQTTHTERQVAERLAARGERLTAGRRAVVRLLGRADGPLAAAEIHRLLESVPLSSIYRTLTVLHEAEVVAPHHASGVTRYEIADWLAGHHHHVVCGECGAVSDVVLPDDLESVIEDVVTAVARQAGFRHDGHSLEVEGTCPGCQ
jgi:Fur family transcriptional regulator, ferric uptake regulator